MPITPHNIVRHELIGLVTQVKNSTNKSQIGLKGEVIDETYSTISIETEKGIKIIPKNITVFIFNLPNKTRVQIDGKLLVGRPEDRIKKKLPRW